MNSVDKNYMKRICLIEGDLGQLNLGLSDNQRQELIDNVDIVIHAAADVRFDKTLQQLCLSNVRGTREIIALVKEMKNLSIFAYISTAYSHSPRDVIEERFYEAPVDPDDMIRVAEYYSETSTDVFEAVTDSLIEPWENTYVFTKALTEELVRRASLCVPTVVIRPSISEYKFCLFRRSYDTVPMYQKVQNCFVCVEIFEAFQEFSEEIRCGDVEYKMSNTRIDPKL